MDLNCRRFGFVQYANYIYFAPASVDNNINPTMMLKNVDITIIPPPDSLISFINPSTKYSICSGLRLNIYLEDLSFSCLEDMSKIVFFPNK